MHARLLAWLLNAQDSLRQLTKNWGTWRGSDPSVALMVALVAWSPLLEKMLSVCLKVHRVGVDQSDLT